MTTPFRGSEGDNGGDIFAKNNTERRNEKCTIQYLSSSSTDNDNFCSILVREPGRKEGRKSQVIQEIEFRQKAASTTYRLFVGRDLAWIPNIS